MFSILFIFMAIVSSSFVWAEFPVAIEKCEYSNAACLRDASSEIIQKHSHGLKEINLLPLEPLRIKTMVVERDTSSAVNVELKLTDLDVYGFKDMNIKSISGFNGNMSGRNIIEGTLPLLQFRGNYEVDGNVLVLPVVGDGPFEADMENANFKFAFDFTPLKKDDKIFATLKHVKLILDPYNMRINFDNLFNGNKLLGDNMNRFLNDNWHEVYSEIKPRFTRSLSLVVKSLISSVFEKYPYNEYFV